MNTCCNCISKKARDVQKQPSSVHWSWRKESPLNVNESKQDKLKSKPKSYCLTSLRNRKKYKSNVLCNNPTIAKPEVDEQESCTQVNSDQLGESKDHTKNASVKFELNSFNNASEDVFEEIPHTHKEEINENSDALKHILKSNRTYPDMFNSETNRSSRCRFPSGSSVTFRRGSLLVRSQRQFHQIEEDLSKADTHIGGERFLDDMNIVTPYAQILAGLRSVQSNISWFTNQKNRSDANLSKSEDLHRLSEVTMNELEWCLQQLENIQTKRPVSDMASTKFKRLLSKKLGSFRSSDIARNQISEYISTTFMDDVCDFEDEDQLKNQQLDHKDEYSKIVPTLTNRTDETDEWTPCAKTELSNSSATARSLVHSKLSKRISNPIPGIENTSSSIGSISLLPYHGISTEHDAELKDILDNSLNEWGLNIFDVNTKSSQHALTVVAYRIFMSRNLFASFNLDPSTVVNYFVSLEASYRASNPYHNHLHAADVLQSVHVLLQAETLDAVFNDVEILSALFASAIHDAHHPGLTNQFLVNTGHELALLYNDSSVLENHHLSVSFRLLTKSGCNIFANIPSKQHQTLRRLVIELVLATDMSKHVNLLAELRTMVETKELAGTGFLNLDDHNDRSLVLQCMLHCADLSNPTKPFNLYKMWTLRVMEEFFQQGDREKQLGIEVSAMCDRDTVLIDKAQLGFIDFVVHPLWETWCDLVHPAAELILESLDSNRDSVHSLSPFSAYGTNSEVIQRKYIECLSDDS